MKILLLIILMMAKQPSPTPAETDIELSRAASVTQFYSKKFDLFDFKGEWQASFGKPERNKTWFIMAAVASGKTTFVCMLCKYLSTFGRVAYNSLEEGISESLKRAFKRAEITAKDKIIVLQKENLAELTSRLKKHKSPDIIVIDTIQHSDIGKREYLRLTRGFPKKTFIIISHMKGNSPEGRIGEFCYQDARVKVRIEGYKAISQNSYGGTQPFIIWKKGAEDYTAAGILK